MNEVVIVGATRSPVGRRNGSLAHTHPADLLGATLKSLIDRTGIDPSLVEQVIGGCVSQVAEQSFSVTRTAWLAAGLPQTAAATTVDSQCGSAQQASSLAASLVASGAVEVAVACGVEVMSMVPMGSTSWKGHRGIPKSYFERYEYTSQFEAAERVATNWNITREDCDEFGALSQDRARTAIDEGRFAEQIAPADVIDVDGDGAQARRRSFSTDEGPRPTTIESLSKLKSVVGDNGVHTAGTSSQISDGAAAVLLMSAKRAEQLGIDPVARLVDHCLVGVDPEMMLTGPIDATQRLMARNGFSIDDLDTVEINEAFASVVVAWERELGANRDIINPNGGAIALGHPLGATGVILLTKAIHELQRIGGSKALVTMCCGGGLGTGTLVERL